MDDGCFYIFAIEKVMTPVLPNKGQLFSLSVSVCVSYPVPQVTSRQVHPWPSQVAPRGSGAAGSTLTGTDIAPGNH